jgi:hypothetical protein
MSFENKLENKITGAIFGFKNGTKTVSEVNLLIKQLKEINPDLAEDYNKKFVLAAQSKNKA